MTNPNALRTARLASGALAAAVESSFGPQPREKLLVSAVGRVLITSSGASILASLVAEPAEWPVARYLIECALGHAASAGEGATAFVLMADAALRAIEAELAPLTAPRRRQEMSRLARELAVLGGHTLPTLLDPRWRQGALAVPLRSLEPAAAARLLRQVGLAIAATSLGAAFPPHASAAVCAALVGALLPVDGPAAEGATGTASLEADAVGLWRLAQRRAAGCAAIVGAAGAAVGASTSYAGLLLRARLLDEERMPHSGEACGLLLLGPRAQPPDAAGAAVSCAQQATVRVSATRRGGGPGGGGEGSSCSAGASLADAARWATDERANWVDAAHAAGVGLILSAGPLSPLVAQLCAARGIAAAAGVEASSLAPLFQSESVQALRRWPRSSELAQLLASPTAGYVLRGCAFQLRRMGGQPWLHLVPPAAAPPARLPRTAVVRAPTEGLAREYARSAERAMATLRLWLGEPRHHLAADHPSVSGALDGQTGSRPPHGTGSRPPYGPATAEVEAVLCAVSAEGATAAGTRVRVQGLVGAPQHNGREGAVLGFDEARGRYAVALAVEAGEEGAPRPGQGAGRGSGAAGGGRRAGTTLLLKPQNLLAMYFRNLRPGKGLAAGAAGRGTRDGRAADGATAAGAGAAERAAQEEERGSGEAAGEEGTEEGAEMAEEESGEAEEEEAVLLCVAGGGAAELQLESLVRELLRKANPRTASRAATSPGCEGGPAAAGEPANGAATGPAGRVGGATDPCGGVGEGGPADAGRQANPRNANGTATSFSPGTAVGEAANLCGGGGEDAPPATNTAASSATAAASASSTSSFSSSSAAVAHTTVSDTTVAGRIRDAPSIAGPADAAVGTPVRALRALSAALVALPQRLHANSGSCAAGVRVPVTAAGGGGLREDRRWLTVLHALREAHDRTPGCRLGLVVRTQPLGPRQPTDAGATNGSDAAHPSGTFLPANAGTTNGSYASPSATAGGTSAVSGPDGASRRLPSSSADTGGSHCRAPDTRGSLQYGPDTGGGVLDQPVQWQQIGDASEALVLHPHAAKLQVRVLHGQYGPLQDILSL